MPCACKGPTFAASEGIQMIDRLARRLDLEEIRVLGCLLEKEQATPEYYPLTVNALVAACNQKNNRNPVLNLTERQVEDALRRLYDLGLVTREHGSRAVRWRHELHHKLRLEPGQKAALTVLLLRGPQTEAEVRARTERMHAFASLDQVQDALAALASPPAPLAMLLEREPGQKEPRWGHRLGSDDSVAGVAAVAAVTAPGAARAPESEAARPPARAFDPELVLRRLERLEQQVLELQAAIKKPGLFD